MNLTSITKSASSGFDRKKFFFLNFLNDSIVKFHFSHTNHITVAIYDFRNQKIGFRIHQIDSGS